MARKRQIDPGIWTSEQFIALSRDARLLFIGLISHSDDEGRLKGSSLHLKVIICPADGILTSTINEWREEIINQGLAILYTIDNQEYICLPKFYKHQYMTRRFPSVLPAAPSVPSRLELVVNNQTRHEIYERDNFTCQYCGTEYEEGSRALSTDDVVPVSKGGITNYENLVTACKSCNSKKNNRTLEEAGMTLVNVGLTPVNDELSTSNAPAESQYTDERFKELLKLSGWGNKDGPRDLVWLLEFAEEFPSFDAKHIRACRDYHSNKKSHTKALWKTRIRNWMKIEVSKQEGQHGRSGQFSGSAKPGSTGYKYDEPT